MIISVVANVRRCPGHPECIAQIQPKSKFNVYVLFPINSVDIKVVIYQRSLIRSRKRSLSLLLPMLLTLSLGATEAV